MNLTETAQLLTAIASYDRRKLGEADVIAWQKLMIDVDLADGVAAVERYYAEQTEWMMPAHVRRLVRDIVQERKMAARDTGWAPGQYGVPREDAAPEVATDGRLALDDLPAAVAEIIARVRADLPEGSREALAPRRVAWEREHRAFAHLRNAEPNPHYRPGGGAGYSADRVVVDEAPGYAPEKTRVGPMAGNLYDPMPDRDDPALDGWLRARGWKSYEEWMDRGTHG